MHNPIQLIDIRPGEGFTRCLPWRRVLLLLLLSLSFALLPAAKAQLDPPPDGDYPGDNTAVGLDALFSLTTGTWNTAIGSNALYFNTGNANTANGYAALINNTTGSRNIGLGPGAGGNLTTGDNNIDIGNINAALLSSDVAGESNTIRIGYPNVHAATFIAGISGVDKSSGNPVFIDANGQLGTGALATGPTGAVVMLPLAGGQAPPAPAGYVFNGFVRLSQNASGKGPQTAYAIYTKS